MADNILRLKVESSEYDAKLKKAAEGIRHLADVAHKGGGDLTGLEKAELDYIKALGNMETKSRTASGQLRELSSTYKELAVVYNNLNDVEKADEGGKALAASLETIKQRAQEAKAQLDSASQSLNDNGEAGKGTSSVMEMLKEKFTVNIDAIKLFNIGLQAAEGALSVAKDAFFASEATVDEWGRIVDSSKSLYEGFLTALNTGDISGYLGRIDEIVQAARTAYNELDRLGTMKTIQAPKMSAQQTENERMRMMIQTGRYIAPVDGRRASMKDGQLLTPEQIRRIEVQLQNGMKNVVALVGNEVKQTGKAIDAVYDRQAKELGLSLSEFRKGTSSMAEFDKRMAGYEQYQKWREQHTTIDMQSGRETVARGNPFEQFAKWGTFRVDGQRYNDLVRLIQQRDQQAGQAYSMQSQAYRTMNRAEGVTVSKLMRGETIGGSGGRGGGGGTTKTLQTELQQNQTKINELTQQYVALMAAASKAGEPLTEEQQKQTSEIQRQISELEKRNGQLKLFNEQAHGRLLPVDTSRVAEIAKDGITGNPFLADNKAMEFTGSLKLQLDEKAMDAVDKQIKKQTKGMKGGWEDAAGAIQAVGSAMSQIEDPAAKVVGTVAQAIATIALGYAQATTQASKMGPWAWIAFAATGLATMISTISAIHSATGYAQGGMIKGNSYSGDNIGGMVDGGAGGFVGLNAGEIVLNRAQTTAIASQLQGNGFGNARLVGRLKGRDILISIDRELSATGKGQLATWK